MKSILLVLTLKIAALAGATLNTVGFLTFFFFDSLAPYRWWLIGGGIALTLLPELASRLVLKRFINNAEAAVE